MSELEEPSEIQEQLLITRVKSESRYENSSTPRTDAHELISPDILQKWNHLNTTLDNLNANFDKVLDAHESDFLMAFKHQMFRLQEQLKTLKDNMDDKLLTYKRDKRILLLEQQLDYFRCQAVRLEKERIGFINENKRLKQRVSALSEDKKYFEVFVIQARQEVEELRKQIVEIDEAKGNAVRDFVLRKSKVINKEKPDFTATESKYTFTQTEPLKPVRPLTSTVGGSTMKSGSCASLKSYKKFASNLGLSAIFRSCITEVKRDIWMKESRRMGKVFYSEKQLKSDQELIKSLKPSDFKLQDKYELLKVFLAHHYVIERLVKLIEEEEMHCTLGINRPGFKKNQSKRRLASSKGKLGMVMKF